VQVGGYVSFVESCPELLWNCKWGTGYWSAFKNLSQINVVTRHPDALFGGAMKTPGYLLPLD
jgi:hypothetical protein